MNRVKRTALNLEADVFWLWGECDECGATKRYDVPCTDIIDGPYPTQLLKDFPLPPCPCHDLRLRRLEEILEGRRGEEKFEQGIT